MYNSNNFCVIMHLKWSSRMCTTLIHKSPVRPCHHNQNKSSWNQMDNNYSVHTQIDTQIYSQRFFKLYTQNYTQLYSPNHAVNSTPLNSKLGTYCTAAFCQTFIRSDWSIQVYTLCCVQERTHLTNTCLALTTRLPSFLYCALCYSLDIDTRKWGGG